MKKQNSQKSQVRKEDLEGRQAVEDFFNEETGQPVPQPKDFEEVDY
ncbi:MAG TPA: hypothetical protein VIG80_04245 [Bacillaceae bacterium]